MVQHHIIRNIVSIWKWAMSTIFNHGLPWSNVTLWQILSQMKMNHGQSWSTIVNMKINHGPMSYCDKDVSMWKSTILNHGQPWSIIMVTLSWRLSLGPMSHYEDHGHPWSNMVQRHIGTKIVSIWKSTMVIHGATSCCDKCFLSMKINHFQSQSNIALTKIVSIWKSTIVNDSQPCTF